MKLEIIEEEDGIYINSYWELSPFMQAVTGLNKYTRPNKYFIQKEIKDSFDIKYKQSRREAFEKVVYALEEVFGVDITGVVDDFSLDKCEFLDKPGDLDDVHYEKPRKNKKNDLRGNQRIL